MDSDTIIVTGGAGFIGSNFVLEWMQHVGTKIINVDLLTYAGNMQNLSSLRSDTRHLFVQGSINDRGLFSRLFAEHKPIAVVNFAAESHVDRSISSPEAFINTNINGTYTLLESSRNYWSTLSGETRENFRFIHISTDEVYGSLGPNDKPFTETHGYYPNSPYSASKAASDHLVRAWYHTYGLPVITTNCSNNYGPYQYPEKLIPLIITHAIAGKKLPIYGDGKNVRDWLFVIDHCDAIREVMKHGKIGETYNIGGWNEKTNVDIVSSVCTLLDEYAAEYRNGFNSYNDLVTFVKDRPGHDRRYAIDSNKIKNDIGWTPKYDFQEGIKATVQWYLGNIDWVNAIKERNR